MSRWTALFLTVVFGLTLAWAASRPPSPRSADAPATVFSAERAMADVRVIAREPHPVGSPENARVRDHLLGRLRGMGLEAEVRPGKIAAGDDATVRVENVLGRLRGTNAAAPALLLMAHYDSVPRSPGAADDAAGVAAILETVRAFRAAGARPARDVVVLLTDGEEAGLLGARAFFAGDAEYPQPGVPQRPADPEAARIGTVLNFEARGAAGRTYLFETGPNNAGLIEAFGRAVASPSASSLARFVYDRMPNGTDFTIPKRLGIPGLNFAFIADEAAYHTPLATPARLDQGSLQHMGDQALAMLTDLASRPAPPLATSDAVYADLFGLILVAYPAWGGWIVLAAAAVLLLVAGWRARGAERPVRGMASGALRLLLGTLLAGLLLHFARRLLSTAEEGLYRAELLAHPGLLMMGVGVIIGVSILAVWSGRRSPAVELGALALGLAMAIMLQALAPETAFIVAWPVLLGAILAASPTDGAAGRGAAVVLGALGLAWIAGLLHLLFLSVGLLAPEALAAGALLLPLVLHPLLGGAVQAAAARRGPARVNKPGRPSTG
jgi:hypothetical protein